MHGQELADLQASGMDWYGQRLARDGQYGPRSKWWNMITCLPQWRQDVVTTALGLYREGAAETTPNRGTQVDKFCQPGGIIGSPWCIAFQSYVFRQCGLGLPYHVSAFETIHWAKREDRVTNTPLPGDGYAFLYDQDAEGFTAGHGGIVLGTRFDLLAVCDGNVRNNIRVGSRPRLRMTTFHSGPEHEVVMPTGLRDLGGPKASTR